MNLKSYITNNENIQERLKSLVKSDDKLNKEIFFFLSRINENEALQKCTQQSLINALLTVMSIGASFNKVKNEVYLIPYPKKVKTTTKDNKQREIIEFVCEVQFNYNFFLTLLQRANLYDGFKCAVVYENDEFNGIDLQTGEVSHKVKSFDRGKITGAYCVINFEGTPRVEIMTEAQIKTVASKAKKFNTTWNEFRDQMILKSILYRTLKYVPLVEKNNQLVEAIKTHEQNFAFNEPKKRKEIAFFTPEIEEKSEVVEQIEQVEQTEIKELEENLTEDFTV